MRIAFGAMPMEPQEVLLSVMDSAKPPLVATVQLERLSMTRRAGRGLARLGMVSGAGAVLTVLPLLHACGLITLLIAGPAFAVFAFKTTVLLGDGRVDCPKCGAVVNIAAQTPGWPARMHCGTCGSTFFIRPSP